MLPYSRDRIPELNEKASGVYYGINAGHTRGHFIRAIMEGLAIALKRMLECEKALGRPWMRYVLWEADPNQKPGAR